ncbi:unnamed protein product [Prunus brigantina]
MCCLFSIDGEPPFTSMSFRLTSVLEGLGELNREGLKKMPLCVALVSEKEQGEDGAFFSSVEDGVECYFYNFF